MSDDTKEWLAGEALRLGNEVRDLSISNAVLRDDNSKLKDENEELHKDYESLADEHTKLIERNKTLKAEVERYKFTLEEERQIARQDWAGLRCEHDRVKRALEQAESEVEAYRSASNEVAAAFLALPKPHNEVARVCQGIESLKAEVERSTTQYNSIIDHQLAVIEGKQAEIDRLNAELFTCSCANANMNKHMNENASLKAEVERLKEALNKMTKTPDGVYGVDVKVNFWTMGGSRLPSSYQTFWTNEPKEGKQP